MLERSEGAKFGVAAFFQDRNDIDVYIEDTAEGYSKIFSNLLSRALNGNVSLERVFPLGGRSNVVDAAINYCKDNGKKSVFIIDGDLNLLLNSDIDLPNNVVILPRYCVENFLVDELAFLKILDEERYDSTIDKLREEFNFEKWMQESNSSLRELFIVFAVSHKLRTGLRTVNRGYQEICFDDFGNICAVKINNIIGLIKSEIINIHGQSVFDNNVAEINLQIQGEVGFSIKYVSAKDYLLPLLLIRLRKLLRNKLTTIGIKLRLSQSCSVFPLHDVSRKILSIAAENNT